MVNHTKKEIRIIVYYLGGIFSIMSEHLVILFTFLGALLALVYAALTARRVLKADEGTEKMKKISLSIRALLEAVEAPAEEVADAE